MKARPLLTLVLWGLAALLILRTCSPKDETPSEVLQTYRTEIFDAQDAPAEQTTVLENDLLRMVWTNRGAGCTLVELLDQSPVGEEGPLVLLQSVPAQPPPPGVSARIEHHRRRDGARLFDPENRLGVALDAVDWQMSEPRKTADGGVELQFQLDTPAGVRLLKTIRLSGEWEEGAPSERQRLVEIEFTTQALESVDPSAIGDLGFRLATGGGILAEPDGFYPNPYAGAGRLEYGEVDSVEKFDPNGKMPARRDRVVAWRGQFAYVVEGSKFFLSAMKPRDEMFRGASAEVLFDLDLFRSNVELKFEEKERQALRAVAQADLQLRAETGRNPGALELAKATGLPEADVLRWRSIWYQAAREERAKSWKRISVAGDFRMHLGGAGTAAETAHFDWYLGPKDPDLLEAEYFKPLQTIVPGVDYEGNIFYRMFFAGTITPIIIAILKFFYGLVGNWGWAIILLTFLVRGIMFPMTRTSQVKMGAYQAKVARLKPEIAKINQKYAKDPAKKQEETMKLYREHKLTPPFGGCLPILLQFPVFIGLFAGLRTSSLLRDQPFLGWIQDLSRPDALIDFGGPIASFFPLSSVTTFNLLPLAMVFLWVFHQRSMPKSDDPQQKQMQKMMTFMPILFGVLLYNYAAGLSLYMITSSFLGIVEQKVIRKHWPVPSASERG